MCKRLSLQDQVTHPTSGKTQTIVEWATELGLGSAAMLHRLREDGPTEKSFRPRSNTGRPKGALGTYTRKDAPLLTDPVTQRSMTLADWAIELGIGKHSLRRRIRKLGLVANVFISSEQHRSRRCGKKTLKLYTDPQTQRSQTARDWAEELGYESAQQFRARANAFKDRPHLVYRRREEPKSRVERQINLVVLQQDNEHYEVVDPESRKVLLSVVLTSEGFHDQKNPSLKGSTLHQVVVAALERT